MQEPARDSNCSDGRPGLRSGQLQMGTVETLFAEPLARRHSDLPAEPELQAPQRDPAVLGHDRERDLVLQVRKHVVLHRAGYPPG